MVVTRVVRRRLRVAILVCGAALVAGACGGGKPDLSLACQMRPCVCKPEKGLFGGVDGEVLFKQNGDAYCPKGQALRTSDR